MLKKRLHECYESVVKRLNSMVYIEKLFFMVVLPKKAEDFNHAFSFLMYGKFFK